ncbi:hypothetical protein FLL45_21525 [Aliikangiella marina]|uniref:DUF6985 domain-containing protein n=1 Tax=Aliikangiella marina TaxID=1712262 RepID=A0A545T124_9GAMM|nr:hypothetical protein [Aliikangiella marina]TQV70912.1 hypothetical protein FLL45_21525 [Aliikangiella marina]
MFGFLSKTKTHELYGEFKYDANRWTNQDSSIFGQSQVELIVPGNQLGLSKKAINTLLEFETDFEFKKPELAETLFKEHYLVTKAAIESGVLKTLVVDYPDIQTEQEIWDHVTVSRVWVDCYAQPGDVEIAICADWDIEQTLGFTFKANEEVLFNENVDID